MAKRRRERVTDSGSRQQRSRGIALAIFGASLAVRIFFWQATPDRSWGWTAYLKGDAPLWLEWARAIETGGAFELGLPIHPPGAAYLVAVLWNGHPSGIAFLRFAWVVIGALVPFLVFLAAERSFGTRVAAIAAAWCAISTGLLVLSTSIDNETPYLALAIGSLGLMEGLRDRPRIGRLLLWGTANGVACLFRVEHALFFVLGLAFLLLGWFRKRRSRALLPATLAVLFFALPLVPWHLEAWNRVARFNREVAPGPPGASYGRRLEWDAAALEKKNELPGFARETSSEFVAATVAHRGRSRIFAEDFGVLEEAFGYFPRPLHRFPFVSSYGPLNFALANGPSATGGFDRAPLEERPPLSGGTSRYPAELVAGLPPADLSFVYPAHLRLFNDGYSIGARWIRDHPKGFAHLSVRKLAIFWAGAASGLTGWNLPMGLSGPRRAVDMVSSDSDAIAVGWRLLVLAFCIAGLFVRSRASALLPWLLLFATKLAVTVLFFGYVRQGATVIPVVALLLALAAERGVPDRPRRLLLAVLAVGVLLEAARFVSKPAVSLGGRAFGAADPFAPKDPFERRVEVSVLRK